MPSNHSPSATSTVSPATVSSSVVQYATVVPDSPIQKTWELVATLYEDSVYLGTDAAFLESMSAQSFSRLLRVHAIFERAGSGTRVTFSGERYIGDTSRRDSIANRPSDWRPVMTTDPQAANLQALSNALVARLTDQSQPRHRIPQVAITPTSLTFSPARDTVLRRLAPGRYGRCRLEAIDMQGAHWPVVDHVSLPDWCPLDPPTASRDPYNTFVLADPFAFAVGDTLHVCFESTVPPGWSTLYFFRDSAHCTRNPASPFFRELNQMVIRRDR